MIGVILPKTFMGRLHDPLSCWLVLFSGPLDSEGRFEPRETSVATIRLQYLLPAVIRVLKRFRVRQRDSGFSDFGMTSDQESLNSIQTAFFSWISQSFLSAKKIQRELYSKIEHQKLRFVPNQNQIVKTIDDGVDRELIKKHDTEPIKYSWAEWQSPLWLFSNVNHFE